MKEFLKRLFSSKTETIYVNDKNSDTSLTIDSYTSYGNLEHFESIVSKNHLFLVLQHYPYSRKIVFYGTKESIKLLKKAFKKENISWT